MNYGDIKDTVLLTLDLPTDMVGDISDLVDLKIKEITNEIAGNFKDKSLLTKVGPVAITGGDDEIPVGVGGFGVTDLVEPYLVTLGISSSYVADRDEQILGYMSYEAWVQLNSFKLGNLRPQNAFTIDLNGNIILGAYPESESWDVYFWYYREISAYTPTGIPEIPIYYRAVITTGVVLEFPQFFKSPERLALYSQLQARHKNLRDQLRAMKGTGKKFMTIKGRTGMGGTGRSIWPRGALSL